MVIQHNVMGLSAYRQNTLNNLQLASSLEKLASGYRINRAADDAAGLAISERMRAQQTGLNQAMANAQDGISLVNTAEGALNEVHGILNRLAELSGQAANGTLQDSQRQSIQQEAENILGEINRISKATNYNGINLLDGSLSGSSGKASVSGVKVSENAPTSGKYEFASMPGLSGLSAGQEISFTMAANNGNSHTVSFTVNDDLSGMTAADGTNYAFSSPAAAGETSANAAAADVAEAVAGELQKTTLRSSFSIESDGAGITLQNRETGLAAPRVTGLSYALDGVQQAPVDGTGTTGADATRTLSRSSFSVFDGENAGSAVFSVNGEKFALVAEDNYAATVAKMPDSSVNFIKVSTADASQLTGGDMQAVAAHINQKTGLAFEANANNGITVKSPMDGKGLSLQVGDTASAFNRISISVGDMSARGLGLDSLSFATQEGASAALSRINAAIDTVSAARGSLGATSNRLESTIKNLDTTYENITAAESRVRDTDMAKMIMNFTRQNVLSQASQAMMAHANMQSQQVLQLLR